MAAHTSAFTVDAISPTAVTVPVNSACHAFILMQTGASPVDFGFRAPSSGSTPMPCAGGTQIKLSQETLFQPGTVLGYILLDSATDTFSLAGN